MSPSSSTLQKWLHGSSMGANLCEACVANEQPETLLLLDPNGQSLGDHSWFITNLWNHRHIGCRSLVYVVGIGCWPMPLCSSTVPNTYAKKSYASCCLGSTRVFDVTKKVLNTHFFGLSISSENVNWMTSSIWKLVGGIIYPWNCRCSNILFIKHGTWAGYHRRFFPFRGSGLSVSQFFS